MGAGGSIQAMLISLKNNGSLLKPRLKIFQKEHPFGERRNKFQGARRKIGLHDKPLSPEEKERIKNAIRSSYRRDSILRLGVTFAILSMIGIGIYFWSRTLKVDHQQSREFQREQVLKNYREALLRGDDLMNAKMWGQAVTEYRTALELRPNSQSLAYKLCLAYCLQCKLKHQQCELAEEELGLQLKAFPRDHELLRLQQSYFGAL